MALKSNREGLRSELVDYLGNIIVDGKLKQDIINANSIDLLWTNANPLSEFSSQTINLDLSSYKAVYINFRASIRSDNLKSIYRSCICLKNSGSNAPSFPDSQYCRAFEVTNSGITFEAGGFFSTYNNDTVTNYNAIAIPVQIYGIK